METEIITIRQEKYEAGITRTAEGNHILWCGDYVANVWEEEFSNLSTAIARLAVLQHLAENDFEQSFSTWGETFIDQFVSFAKWNTSNTNED